MRRALCMIAVLCLASLPLPAQQHAQVGPQIITIPSNNPGQPITIKVPFTAQLVALQSFFSGAYPKKGTRNVLGATAVTWVSNTQSVATVDTSGLLTAVGGGSAIITARYGRLTGTVQVNVIGLAANGLNISPINPTVPKGDFQPFTATGTYTDSSTAILTDFVTWASSNTSVATISNNPGSQGVAQAVNVSGSSTISCYITNQPSFNCSNTTTLTAAIATADFVVVSPHSAKVTVFPAPGSNITFTAFCLYSDGFTMSCAGDANHASVAVTWSSGGSGDSGTASILPTGTATGLTTGTVTITAAPALGTCRGTACIAGLNVGLTSVNAIVPAAPTMPKGTTQQFTVSGNFGASPQDITKYVSWCSTPVSTTPCFPKVPPINVSMNSTGLATAVGVAGTSATIFAGLDPCIRATNLGTFCASTTASVIAPVLTSIAIKPTSTTLALGKQRQYTAAGTYSDNSTAVITNSVTWNSSNTSAASFVTVASPGLLTASTSSLQVNATTNITATLGSVTSPALALTIGEAVLNSITLSPKNPSVPTGDSQQFIAKGHYSDGVAISLPYDGSDNTHTAAAITWSSSSPNAATIDQMGNATAIGKNGTTTIAATSGTVVGSTLLTVAPAALISIVVSAANGTLYQDSTLQYFATGHYSDGSTQALTTTVTWASNDTSVATISNSVGSEGLATGVAQGSVTFSASYTPPGGTLISGNLAVNVQGRTLNTITVTPANLTLPPNQTQQYTATGTYNCGSTNPCGPNADITNSVNWTSSNTSAATVDMKSGLATTVATGSTTITATDPLTFIAGSGLLMVSQPTLVSITISPNSNVAVPTNQSLQFTATGNYSDGSNQNLSDAVIWSLAKNLGDSIDNTGLYTAGKTPGQQTVTATLGSTSDSVTFTVTF